ncbi:MAG: CFI-box-CTERM domain-containing protein, partial [Gammaproteobacteria bacterium]
LTINFTDDADPSMEFSETVALSGEGVGTSHEFIITDNIDVPDDLFLNFGKVARFDGRTAEIEVSNNGAATVDLTGFLTPPFPLDIFIDECAVLALAPAESCKMLVTFAPTSNGPYPSADPEDQEDIIQLEYGGADGAETIGFKVSAEVESAKITVVDSTEPTGDRVVDFDFLRSEATPVSETVTVSNITDEAIIFGDFDALRAGDAELSTPPFSIDLTPDVELDPRCTPGFQLQPSGDDGDTCSFDVIADPVLGTELREYFDDFLVPIQDEAGLTMFVFSRIGIAAFDIGIDQVLLQDGIELEGNSLDGPSGMTNFEYRIEVRNAGPDPADMIEIEDILPAGLVLGDGTGVDPAPVASVGNYNPATGVWTIAALESMEAEDEPATLTLYVRPDGGPIDCFVNTATLKSVFEPEESGDIFGDQVEFNNESVSLLGITNPGDGAPTCADISAEIIFSQTVNTLDEFDDPFKVLEIAVGVLNNSPHDATNVLLSGSLSSSDTPVDADRNELELLECPGTVDGMNCLVDLLAVDESFVVIYSLSLKDLESDGGITDIQSFFHVRTDTDDPIADNNFAQSDFRITESLPPVTEREDDNDGCFIATAAFGTYWEPNVLVLRQWRDNFLLRNEPGRAFVAAYYRHSPPVADWIAEREWARAITRGVLTPLVFAVKHPLSASALMFVFVFGGFGVRRYARPE